VPCCSRALSTYFTQELQVYLQIQAELQTLRSQILPPFVNQVNNTLKCTFILTIIFFLRFDVVSCLSEIVRNATLQDQKHIISRDCRQQLKVQLLQQHENIDFDPRLKASCGRDIELHCANVLAGSAQVYKASQLLLCPILSFCKPGIGVPAKSAQGPDAHLPQGYLQGGATTADRQCR
jgi:Cysteine rich repeat